MGAGGGREAMACIMVEGGLRTTLSELRLDQKFRTANELPPNSKASTVLAACANDAARSAKS